MGPIGLLDGLHTEQVCKHRVRVVSGDSGVLGVRKGGIEQPAIF